MIIIITTVYIALFIEVTQGDDTDAYIKRYETKYFIDKKTFIRLEMAASRLNLFYTNLNSLSHLHVALMN